MHKLILVVTAMMAKIKFQVNPDIALLYPDEVGDLIIDVLSLSLNAARTD